MDTTAAGLNRPGEPGSPGLAVIVPVLNEAAALRLLLPQLAGQRGVRLEVVVCDGGSADGSAELAESLGARVVVGAPGRGRQMNAGVEHSRAPMLLFLHADSEIDDPEFLRRALEAMPEASGDRPLAGHFALRFRRSGTAHETGFRYLEEKTRSGRYQTVNGDQGMLVSRDWFHRLGGFDESMGFFEDQIIAERIFRQGRWVLLPGTLVTSGRRFEVEGFHRRYILMSLIMGLYWADVREFFPRARGLYRQQRETSRLRLWPFFAAIWRMMAEDLGWRGSFAAWYRVGRYVRGNSWQLFFFGDVLLRRRLGPDRYPLTRFHDRVFRPLTDHRLGDVINTGLVFVWFMLVLGPYFYLADGLAAEPPAAG